MYTSPLISFILYQSSVLFSSLNHSDFGYFSNEELEILPPNIFSDSPNFSINILVDVVFEAGKQIVVILSRPNKFTLPEPFTSDKIGSPPGSVVKPPDDNRVLFDLPSTTIFIGSGNSLSFKEMWRLTKYYLFSGFQCR